MKLFREVTVKIILRDNEREVGKGESQSSHKHPKGTT